MRKVLIEDLKGGEILAKEIVNDADFVIIGKGSKIKEKYLPHLKAMKIKYVFIEDEYVGQAGEIESKEIEVIKECKKEIVDILDKFSYCGKMELLELKEIAEEIVTDVMKQEEIVYNVSKIAEYRKDIYAHSLQVCGLAVLLAVKLKMTKQMIEQIVLGCLLHDIGYLYLKVDYQHKNYSEFTEEEQIEVKKHVVYGYTAVENEKWISQGAKNIIIMHHERNNGSGYPFRYTEERISKATKLVSVCDTFDRMIRGLDEAPVAVKTAVEYIKTHTGTLFDAGIVEVFLKSVAIYPNGTYVMLSNEEVAIVVRQNAEHLDQPIVCPINTKEKKENFLGNEINLEEEKELYIIKVLDNI